MPKWINAWGRFQHARTKSSGRRYHLLEPRTVIRQLCSRGFFLGKLPSRNPEWLEPRWWIPSVRLRGGERQLRLSLILSRTARENFRTFTEKKIHFHFLICMKLQIRKFASTRGKTYENTQTGTAAFLFFLKRISTASVELSHSSLF